MAIKTSMQLKALIRNMSKGNNTQARLLMCNYAMERFLERISISAYKDNLILKGGCLMASIVGLNKRLTMDIDLTTKMLTFDDIAIADMVREIAAIHIDDGMTFEIKNIRDVMNERQHTGSSVSIEARLDNTVIPFKLDFSMDDVITPKEIKYSYNTMFGDGRISILSYTLETVIAEKLVAMLTLGIGNTRMKDFYDLYILYTMQTQNIDADIVPLAFANTCKQRGLQIQPQEAKKRLIEVSNNTRMMDHWKKYREQYDFAADIGWNDVIKAAEYFCVSIYSIV